MTNKLSYEELENQIAELQKQNEILKSSENSDKNTRKALKKSEEFFKGVIENTSDIILIVNKIGTFKYVSPSVENILGYRPDELIGKKSFQYIHPADIPRAIVDYGKAILTEQVIVPNSFHILHKDGSVKVLEGIGKNQFKNPAIAGFIMNIHDITNRLRLDQKLDENEKRYQQIFQFSPDSIIIHDLYMNILDVNNKAVVEFGYSKQELLEMKVFNLHHETELKHSAQVLAAMKKTDMLNVESKFVRKDGSVFWAEATPRKYTIGSKTIIHVAIRDIAKRKMAEDKLKKSEHNYRVLFDNISDGIFVLDAETMKVVISNKAIAKIYGFDSEKDTVYVNPIDFILPEDKEAVYKIIAEDMFKNNLQQTNEFRSLTKDRREIWVSAIGVKTEYQGRLAGLISIRDITERKQAEEEINRMAKILDIAPNSITIHDFNGNFIYANQKTFDIHGYTRDEFFALPLDKLDTPETTKLIPARMKEISERGKANFQVEHVRKDGSIFPMEIFAQLTKWGNTNSILSIATDITERKQAEAIKIIQYEIIRIVFSTNNLSEFYEMVRGALGRIMNVENFYVAFYDEKTDQFSAVFEKDKKDQIPSWPSGKSLTGRVIKEQKPLILKKAEILNLANTGEIELIGTTAEAWLGVPLIIGGKVSGVLVVQDYDNPKAYNQTHLELLEMVSTEMSICIERKQTEEALKQRESILTAIFESTADGLLVVDNNGKVIHRNTKFNKMWHIPSKLINSTDDTKLLDFVLSKLSEPNLFIDKVKELYKSSKSDYDVIYFKDGRIFERRSNPLLMGSSVNGRVWSFNDITERKQTERRYRKMFENMKAGVAIYLPVENGNDFIFLDFNRAAEKITNTLHNKVIGKTLLSQFPNMNKTPFFKALQKVNETNKDIFLPAFHYKDTQREGWRENYIYKLSTGEIIAIFDDVTNLRNDEIKLQKKNKELIIAKEKIEESEEKHRTVADYANDWEYWIDTNGNFVYISPSCKRITGYKPDDFLNNKELMQEIIYPDDVNIFQNHKHDIDENMERNQTEFRIITKQKKIRWIGHVCQNVIATNGKLLGVRGSNRDISDRKKAEQALMKSKAELKEFNATKDKLYSIIAHDLRSPFNSILGFSDLLMNDANLRDIEKTLKYSTLMNTTAKHTLALLDNLLNWGKLQTGKINFKQENVGLQPIIQEILDTLNSTAILKNISLNQIQSDDIVVYADENMLKTILRNLISNAIKYTETGGNVNIFVIPVKNQIEISISDDGVGMKDETRKKLFDISTNITTKGTANEKGSGLGLVLCKEFVEKNGGRIWAETEEGKGSIFYFTLPYTSEKMKEKNAKNEDLTPAEVTPVKKLKILIVEDDETSEMFISIAVKIFEKEIISVRTGTEAVAACLNNPDIDLVLMDIQLPEMDGYEATRQIRKFNKDIIIIAQTAYALEGDKEKAITAGCDDYISKPIKKEELFEKIEKLIGSGE